MFLDGIDEEEQLDTESGVKDFDALVENMFFDKISSLDEQERKEFLASDACKALEEGGMIGKKTFVRLNKLDDLARRMQLAVYQKAKEDGDPNYVKLKKVQAKKRELKSKLMAKYGNRVKNDVLKAQRALIKVNPTYFTRPVR